MFHELCVGNNNKIQVLWVSQPENLEIESSTIKKIFHLEYLNTDFHPEWEKQEEGLIAALKGNISEFSEKEIVSLSSFLNDIGRIQYKKITKMNWQNRMARIIINELCDKEDFEADEMQKIYNVVPLFSNDYLAEYQEEILNSIKL